MNRLPASFASITTPELQTVRCVRKELLRHETRYDVSEIYPMFRNHETRGEIFFHRHQTPVFGVEEVLNHSRHRILLHFCILPLTYQDHERDFQLPVVMIMYEGGRGWTSDMGGAYSFVVEIAPRSLQETIYRLLGSVYDDLRRNIHLDTPFPYGERRWPPGIRVETNFDPEYDTFDTMLDGFDSPPPRQTRVRGQGQQQQQQQVVPRGGEPSSTPPVARAIPSRPSERVALALARDFIQEKEICPITQDSIQYGRVAVTGCLCVFQAEALEAAQTQSCPTCRTHLVYRVVDIQPKLT